MGKYKKCYFFYKLKFYYNSMKIIMLYILKFFFNLRSLVGEFEDKVLFFLV